MAYQVRKPVIGSFPSFNISDEEMSTLRPAKEVLFELQSIEEKFDFVVENYRDLQNEIFKVLIDDNIYNHEGIGFIYDHSRIINVRLLNFLNSADFCFKHLKISTARISKEKSSTFMKIIPSRECTSEAFKLLNTLRDHFQHNGVPTFSSSGGSWIGEDNRSVLTHYLHIELRVEDFLKDTRVQRIIKKETYNGIATVELNSMLKQYLQDVSEIIEAARELFSEEYKQARSAIESIIERYIVLFPKMSKDWQKVLGIWDTENKIFILKFNQNSIELIERLRSRNSKQLNLKKRVFTDLNSIDIEHLKHEAT